MRVIPLTWENDLHTQNVCVRRMKYFPKVSEIKVFAKNSHKMGSLAELQRLEFQKNPLGSHFSFNDKCFVSRMVMIQSALNSTDLGKCFTSDCAKSTF